GTEKGSPLTLVSSLKLVLEARFLLKHGGRRWFSFETLANTCIALEHRLLRPATANAFT
ncbi:hypothetical protein B0A55_13055, partial [Friedmanniomyces simplex]